MGPVPKMAAQAAPHAVVYPLAELRVERAEALRPAWLRAVLRHVLESVQRPGVPAPGVKPWIAAMRFPMQLDVGLLRVALGQTVPVLRLTMPVGGEGTWRLLWGAAGGTVEEAAAVELDGAEYRRFALRHREVWTALSAERDGMVEWWLAPAEHFGDPAAVMAGFVRYQRRASPAERALRAAASGGDLGFVLRARGLTPAEWAWSVALPWIVGPRFAGVAGRLRRRDGGEQLELFADVRVGSGWLGALIPREVAALDILGWVPETATDYTALQIDVGRLAWHSDLLVEMLTPQGRQAPWGWCRALPLSELVDGYATGQLFVAAQLGGDDPLIAASGSLGAVVGVGVLESAPVVEALRAACAAGADVELRPAAELGPGVMTVVDGGVEQMHVTALRDVVLLAPPDERGAAMLRACLAAGGRSGLRSDGRHKTVVGRGRVLRRFREAVPMMGAIPGLVGWIDAALAEHEGDSSWSATGGGEGLWLRIDV